MGAEPRAVSTVAVAELARTLDSLTTSVLLVDARHCILHLNVAAETLLGTSRNQAIGRPLNELLRGGELLLSMIDRVVETQRPFSRRELTLRPAGSDVDMVVDCTLSALDDASHAGAVLLEINDATQHKRISRENALLAQVGGSRLMIRQLAHEIKNPLGGLRGAAQLLERQLSDATMREYTSVIINEADRLKTLVDTLLGPGHAPRKQLINIHEMLQHVWQLLKLEAPSTIDVARDYDPSLPPLKLDRDQIIQVLLNLGRNALQALTPTNGNGHGHDSHAEKTPTGKIILRSRALTNVYIGTRRYRLVASVQFEDNGPGVPDHLRETLFYPLVTGRAEGTGLGLAVAQDLANRHEGLIEFESRPGRTVFTVLLPFDVSDANETA
jgi:two-component system nitrogen regulation sensor histidine kinase GlnL